MDWNRRYLQQARWTRSLRSYLFDRAGVSEARRVLEVGCGAGAVLPDLYSGRTGVFGIDLALDALQQCRLNVPHAHLLNANAYWLPFPDQAFDIGYCHFLLLWLRDPIAALGELKRVVRTGGHVLAIAEPDYSGRNDEPAALADAGQLQNRSLERQGADISVGSRLPSLFIAAGIHLIESGPLKRAASATMLESEVELEWLVLESDLKQVTSAARVEQIREADDVARRAGTRRTYVPTYYAWGQV